MNSKVFIGIVTVLIVVVGGFFVFSQPNDDMSEPRVSDSSQRVLDMSLVPTDLPAMLTKVMERQSEPNVYVIDVRTQAEWEAGHIEGAMLWGLAEEISLGNLPPVPKNAELYIYCRTGNRSGQAIRIMQDAGFTNMVNTRGLSDWQTAGGSIATGL